MKQWDEHVTEGEEVARTPGFRALRDRIVELAGASRDDVVVDIGAGTGLLTLALAPCVQRVWAVDISRGMCDYLDAKARSGGLENVVTAVSSAVSLPLVDGAADVVVSNYCFHHLDSGDEKLRALKEARRVLKPGGTLVFGDMMFTLDPRDARDRQVVGAKVRSLARRGPAGIWRLTRNGLRVATGRWESPANADWWSHALGIAGFTDVGVALCEHEGGVARARRPVVDARRSPALAHAERARRPSRPHMRSNDARDQRSLVP